VAKYIQITNDNNKVIIDDNYIIPKLILRTTISTSTQVTQSTTVTSLFPSWSWRGNISIVQDSARKLGFDIDSTVANGVELDSSLILACRPVNANIGFSGVVSATINDAGQATLSCSVFSNTQNAQIEVCIYTTHPRLKRAQITAAAMNGNGDLIFDARRGCLQNMGVLTGGVNVNNDPAVTYTINVPSGLLQENVFITSRSSLPYYSALKYSASGVSYADTFFEPIFDFSQANKVLVSLRRQRYVAGNNVVRALAGYFENVIYCHQPPGNYLNI